MTISWILHVSLAVCISSLRVSVSPLDDDQNSSPFDVAEYDKALKDAVQFQIAHKSFADKELESGEENLCMDGRLAPEYYLIGQWKAASCSFSAMLGHPQIVRPQVFQGDPPYYKKELHFFDTPARFNQGREFWLSHFPKCTKDTRQAATDLTPHYLNNWEVPKRIQEAYGEQAHKIKFGVVLRDPAHRIQTIYHFSKAKGNEGWGCQYAFQMSFKAYVQKMVNNDEDPCGWLQDNKYETHLSHWLKFFNSSQFTLIPYHDVVAPKNGQAEAIQAAWKSVGIAGTPPKVAHVNGTPHASLEDELGADLLKQYKEYVSNQQGLRPRKLARLIVENNIKLHGYENPSDSVEDALKYLLASW